MHDLKVTMSSDRTHGLQENQARESHYLAMQSLKNIEQVTNF